MGLSAAQLGMIDTYLAADTADAAAVTALRQALAGPTITRCDLGDVDQETPYRSYPRFTVFLVDASDHCWVITTDPARATGLVVASN